LNRFPRELRGESVYPVCPEEKSAYASISKTKTFSPPSSDADYLFAHLMRNLESACIKARRYRLAAWRIGAFLKGNDFRYAAREIRLSRPSVYPMELSAEMRGLFGDMYRPRELYRATGVVLMELVEHGNIQYGLFEDAVRAERVGDLYRVADEIGARYGKHSLHLGASHGIEEGGSGKRGEPTAREQKRLFGETRRKRLGIPLLHLKVDAGASKPCGERIERRFPQTEETAPESGSPAGVRRGCGAGAPAGGDGDRPAPSGRARRTSARNGS